MKLLGKKLQQAKMLNW